ncbi:sensor histidine kinase [Filimonas lacunae]|nr:sensor histidine kinase [Filimonas lacunae]
MYARPGLALLNTANVLCYLSVITLQVWNRYLSLRLYCIAATGIIFFAEALFYSNGMEFALLLTVICGLVLTEKTWHYLLLMLLVVAAFCYLQYYQRLALQLDKPMVIRVVGTVASCLLLLTAGLFYFRGIYVSYHQLVEGQKQLLEQQQVQLLQQQAELVQKNADLKALSESRQKILLTLAHDLHNPLSGIEALTNLMVQGVIGEHERNSLLQVISNTANRSLQQMQDVLDAQRFSDASYPLVKEEVFVSGMVQEVVGLLQFKAAEKQIHLQCTLPDTTVTIMANRLQLMRVLENLVMNAIKFSYLNSVVKIQATIADDWLLLSVCDEGMGIALDKQEFVFNDVSRVQQLGTKGEKSFGLGLSICRQIVERHGGYITLTPGKAKGCEFVASFPVKA